MAVTVCERGGGGTVPANGALKQTVPRKGGRKGPHEPRETTERGPARSIEEPATRSRA